MLRKPRLGHLQVSSIMRIASEVRSLSDVILLTNQGTVQLANHPPAKPTFCAGKNRGTEVYEDRPGGLDVPLLFLVELHTLAFIP